MASDQQQHRDAAVRAMLVERVTTQTRAHGSRQQRERLRLAIVTAVVLVAIVAVSALAVGFGTDRSAPAQLGVHPTSRPLPSMTIPAGKVLGRFTSADGAVQKHTIHPDGLALATVFSCTGGDPHSQYMVHIPHYEDDGGSCSGGSAGSANKGLAGAVTLTITTTKQMHWTFTVVGIPETYVTPRPVASPTDTTGSAVRYCTADDLRARFAPHRESHGTGEVNSGDLVLTNRSTSACALAGYPEVRFLKNGAPLGHHTMNAIDERDSMKRGLRAVVIAPGSSAYSQIGWYLPNFYPANDEGVCHPVAVKAVQVDLAYDLTSPGQTGSLDVPVGSAKACLNGAHGALGKYGQLSSTVFVDYARN